MAGGGNKKRFQYCTDSSGAIQYLRALQGHSGRNLIDPSLQDYVVILDGLFMYIYHVGCAINFHSIINSGLIPGGQNLSKRQTVFFLLVDPMDNKNTRILTQSTWEHRVLHITCKQHGRNIKTLYWVDIKLAQKKGLKFYQTRSNAIILHDTLPAYCIPKVVRMENGEVINEKVYASPRPPPKISLKHDRMKELGSEVARQPDGEPVQQSKSSHSNQTSPTPDHDRTGQPVVCRDTSHAQGASQTRSSHESTNFNVEDETNHDRTGKPVVCRDTNHEQSMLNVVDIDFRMPGLPHAVVKQAENYRVRELVKEIENHPHRQSLQRDLQQNKAYNPFSTTSEKMIQDMGNVGLFELFETDPKTKCKECLSYWSEGVVYCTCWHLLKESEAKRGVIQYALDLLSIPDYVIRNGRPHGHRYGQIHKKRHIIEPII